MTTYPLPTLAAQVDVNGISAPAFVDILGSLQAQYKTIFGADAYLEADSQDGQWLGILALAIKDANDMAIAIYNAYSPQTAQGNGLDSAVKINGLHRMLPSNSTAEGLIVGVPGTIIVNGLASDALGNIWKLPDEVIIPDNGQLTLTLTAQLAGDTSAPAGSITTIQTPVLGWQSVTNPADAVPGAPVESDATLRRRQAVSTALPAQAVLTSITGAIANLPGVFQLAAFENWTDITDINGIPGHSFSVVVQGGDDTAIATEIAVRKPPGTGTFGNTTEVISDEKGIPTTINFMRVTVVPIRVEVTLKAGPTYVSTTGTAIQQMLAADVSGSGIGVDIDIARLYVPAQLAGDPLALSYKIVGLRTARDAAPLGSLDILIAFNEVASLAASDVSLLVS